MIAYACAIKSADNAMLAAARERAVRLGLSEGDLAAVAEARRQIIADSGS